MRIKTEMDEEMKLILADVEAAVDAVSDWQPADTSREPQFAANGARAFEGQANGWHFVITDFDLEDQGFPKGSRGCDGGARNSTKGQVMHLTRELAQRGMAAAVDAVEGRPSTPATQRTADGMPICDRHTKETGLGVTPVHSNATPEPCLLCMTRAVYGRTCDHCDRMLHPRWPAVYCSNQCALDDA
jgi:hypothetical protein